MPRKTAAKNGFDRKRVEDFDRSRSVFRAKRDYDAEEEYRRRGARSRDGADLAALRGGFGLGIRQGTAGRPPLIIPRSRFESLRQKEWREDFNGASLRGHRIGNEQRRAAFKAANPGYQRKTGPFPSKR